MVPLREDRHILHHLVEKGTACVHVRPHLRKVFRLEALIAKEHLFVTARIRDTSLPLEMPVLLHLLRVVAKVEHLEVEEVLSQDLLQLRNV
jgi:hypothetical protein